MKRDDWRRRKWWTPARIKLYGNERWWVRERRSLTQRSREVKS